MGSTTVWDYSFKHGQHTWGQHWENGKHQSPINIVANKTEFDSTLKENPLSFKSTPVKFNVVNKGINISFAPEEGNSMTKGPHNDAVYNFAECHFHWGRNFGKGSEHEIDCEKSEAELHLVHKNSAIKDNLEHPNGLSVLGIMLDIGDKVTTHPVLKGLLDIMKNVPYKGDEYAGETALPIYDLLNGISDKYFTYDGSLTTPPIAECVKWIVFKEPLIISREDYEVFNNLYPVKKDDVGDSFHDPYARAESCLICKTKPLIGNNYRDTCCINERTVRKSFE